MTVWQIKKMLDGFAQIPLGVSPTPIQTLIRTQEKTGFSPIYMKRDDLNGMGIGGNKVRNLEFLLGAALEQGCDTVIVSGQLQSNLCALTAAACGYAGLQCVIVHNSEKPSSLTGNACINDIMGANMIYLGETDEIRRKEAVLAEKQRLQQTGKKAYIIENGASTPIGALGYIKGVCELALQIEAQQLSIGHLCIPVGNGGLAAGVVFGTALLGNPFHVELISVEHTKENVSKIMSEFILQLEGLTQCKFPCAPEEAFTIHENYRFGGWGVTPAEVTETVKFFARTEGILTEKVYTSKVIYGILDLIQKEYFSSGICYLHSGGMGALFSQFKNERC